MARKSYRVSFPSGNGQERLTGIIDRPDDSESHPVLVFSHCFTCNKDLKSTVRIARALAELGVAVLRFDMTGLGGSSGDFSETNFSTNCDDLKAAIRFAHQELGAVTGLMGHSFGGAASLALAGDWPAEFAPLRALITLAAPSDTVHLANLLAKMDPTIESDGVGEVSIGGFQWQIRRATLEDFRQHELTNAITKIQCPTMVIHSAADTTVSFDHAIRIVGLIQSSPAKSAVSLMSLYEADHLVSNADDITHIANCVASFLVRYASKP